LIDTTNIEERQLIEVLWEIVTEINNLEIEIQRIKSEMCTLIQKL